jgi:hypothetical protein
MGNVINSGECDEIILFEGTSGGIANFFVSSGVLSGNIPTSGLSGNFIGVVNRGVQGTPQQKHYSGSVVTQVTPDAGYGINLTTYEKGQFIYPAEWTSGGIQGANIVPQTQTVKVLDAGGATVSGVTYYSGQVQVWDGTQGQSGWLGTDYCWLMSRTGTGEGLGVGQLLDGQRIGYTPQATNLASPGILYSVNPSNSFALTVAGSRNYTATNSRTYPFSTLSRTLYSGSMVAIFRDINGFPTDENWWGTVLDYGNVISGTFYTPNEVILFGPVSFQRAPFIDVMEPRPIPYTSGGSGTWISGISGSYYDSGPSSGQYILAVSGGLVSGFSGGYVVPIVQRGYTPYTVNTYRAVNLPIGSGLATSGAPYIIPSVDRSFYPGFDEAYNPRPGKGTNNIYFRGDNTSFWFGGVWSGGGNSVRQQVIVPEMRTIRILSASGIYVSGTGFIYPGETAADTGDSRINNPYLESTYPVWVKPRNPAAVPGAFSVYFSGGTSGRYFPERPDTSGQNLAYPFQVNKLVNGKFAGYTVTIPKSGTYGFQGPIYLVDVEDVLEDGFGMVTNGDALSLSSGSIFNTSGFLAYYPGKLAIRNQFISGGWSLSDTLVAIASADNNKLLSGTYYNLKRQPNSTLWVVGREGCIEVAGTATVSGRPIRHNTTRITFGVSMSVQDYGYNPNGTPTDVLVEVSPSYIQSLIDSTAIPAASAPGSMAASATSGTMAFDSDYLYVALASGNWKRVLISGW